MVMHGLQAVDAWEAGDPGTAIGQGIQAAAGVLVIAVAGAECADLLTGAAAASWTGPVGWIAAGLMLIGTVVIAVWSKNDMEQFAQHCFLGTAYGVGDWDKDTGETWMVGLPWPALRYARAGVESRDRWQRQRIALLRLISGFKVWIGPADPWGQDRVRFDGVGGIVHPTYLTDAACFHVRITIKSKGQSSPQSSYEARVWPRNRPEFFWVGQQRQDRVSQSSSPVLSSSMYVRTIFELMSMTMTFMSGLISTVAVDTIYPIRDDG
ncbi:hypothetical protein C2W62_40685 [Candidatus Entotheonella serta]|nr:hypothetical protein C2W62_40685 [Candidatus Entotheonella serta]